MASRVQVKNQFQLGTAKQVDLLLLYSLTQIELQAERVEEHLVNVRVAAQPFDSSNTHGSAFERFPAHETSLGSLKVLRALPIRQKRLVGAWCFLDRFGPLSFSKAKPMDLAPHPHIDLQTVSWLLQGEVVHKDSLGNERCSIVGCAARCRSAWSSLLSAP
jgi:Pirin